MRDGFVNQLGSGDSLEVLRKMPDQIADLITLDPPFYFARNYDFLVKRPKSQDSPAQFMAFEDTRHCRRAERLRMRQRGLIGAWE